MTITELTHCRACSSTSFDTIMDLGNQYIVDFVKNENETPRGKAPVVLVKCLNCNLVQLKHTVDPETLFSTFYYKSGVNEGMVNSLREVVDKASRIVKLQAGDAVLDIGSNDGTTLSNFPHSVKTVGVEPAIALALSSVKNRRLDEVVVGLFPEKLAQVKYHGIKGKFKLILAIAMFYDIEKPLEFLKACQQILDQNGMLVIQMNYLMSMLENCSLDNIAHEHLTYYSLASLQPLIEAAGLSIAGAEVNSVNGGSIRLYITHDDGVLSANIAPYYMSLCDLQYKEMQAQLETMVPYNEFKRKMEAIKMFVEQYIAALYSHGKKIYLYGASTRVTALLHYIDIGKYLTAAAERDPNKYGLKMVGTWTPIKSEEECRREAHVFFVGPYHFWETIKRREDQWIANGGQFVIPLPRPRVAGMFGELPLVGGDDAKGADYGGRQLRTPANACD